MAQLDKMTVRGIRSFSPAEEQMIKFCPLTLILGVNGAGKTTLIEALRYVTSGELPPGTGSGKSWVHDSQIKEYGHTIKGQVKLAFRGGDECLNTVTRSVEVITKRDKNQKITQQFKTLDSILKRKAPDGTVTTLPSRCAEIDKEMLSLLGVSKAVLTNVVFCHQEDNCWPMSEGKVLKEKFDQIFGSMGYVKALTKIKKQREENMKETKTLKEHLNYWSEVQMTKEKMEKDLKQLQATLETQRTNRNGIDAKLNPLQKELAQISLELKSHTDIQSKIASKKARIAEKTSNMTYLKEKIGNVFQGSLEDLRLKKEEFLSGFSKREEELGSIASDIRKLDGDIRMSNNKSGALQIQKGQNDQQHLNLKNSIETRDDFISKMRKKKTIDFDADPHLQNAGAPAEDSVVIKILGILRSKMEEEESISRVMKIEYDQELEKLESELDAVKTNRTRISETIKIKEETQSMREAEIKELISKLQSVESSAGDVISHSEEIQKLTSAIREKILELADDMDTQLSQLKVSKYKLDNDVMDFKKSYNDMIRNLVSNISDLKKDGKESEVKITEMRAKIKQHKDDFLKQERMRNQQLEILKESFKKLCLLNSEVEKCNETGDLKEAAAQIIAKQDEVNQKIEELQQTKSSLLKKEKEIRREIDGQKTILREFEDNEKLMSLETEIIEMQELLKKDENVLTERNFDGVKKKENELKKKESKLMSEKGGCEGQMTLIDGQILKLERDLRDPKYLKASSEFKKALIDVVTLETMCDDLNKYYRVLDRAVNTYHVRKMAEVNHLMGHFWRITYQGTDIETIKIVCDDQKESTADKRKTYNYRVVMVKEMVEMDMRGRCSMGQKVLASLVIRIALAQIFCVNCSILTLDEPTTNLDKNNIEALSKAISGIVEDQRGKLQLVIITHDQEFLKYLNEEFSEYYFKVCKEDGYSKIERHSIRERD